MMGLELKRIACDICGVFIRYGYYIGGGVIVCTTCRSRRNEKDETETLHQH